MIDIAGVTYTYPESTVPALRGVSLDLTAGITVICGASGSGKSTLLRLCNGLVPQFHGGAISGSVRIAGRDARRTPTREMARDVGFVFQDAELQAVGITCERDVAFGLANTGMSSTEINSRVAAALLSTGLEGFASRPVRTLSGGERQRLALASVLALEPGVVVLDEPFAQLDHDGAATLAALLARLAERGHAVVVAEHDLTWVPADARRITMDRGRIVGDERASPLISPVHATTPRRESVHSSRPPVVSLRDVTVGVDGRHVAAIDDIDARAGDIVAITGRNGAGKTTLLRTIAGAIPAAQGRVVVSSPVAYLPQNPGALLCAQSVAAEIALTLRHTPSPDHPETWAGHLGITSLLARNPRDLSGGERQRAALAVTLSARAPVVLLDEPTRGMDDDARLRLINALRRAADDGACVMVATHDRRLIAESCDIRVDLGESARGASVCVAAAATP